MRKTLHQLITAGGSEIPAARWFPAGAVEENPAKPFGTYRLSGTTRGVNSASKARIVRLDITVHDDPGSYLRIDRILDGVEGILDAVVHASAAPGDSLSQATWESRGPDLNDEGYGTVCRTTTYTIVGKG